METANAPGPQDTRTDRGGHGAQDARSAAADNRSVRDPAAEPPHRIRAVHTETTVTVYQAYPPEIGLAAARDGRFPEPWKRDRMTWVKPSFLWMMYRCGWATKAGQETVLAVEIERAGLEWALEHACLAHYRRGLHPDRAAWQRLLRRSPARVQWDPERDLRLRPLPYRSLQLGLAGEAARRYADEWTVSVTDVTPLVHRIHGLLRDGEPEAARSLLPAERAYPVRPGALAHLGGDGPG
ncbi:DUF4291 domain-containing protein [Kitasatospora sp. NPDC056327]|uniref:DUF4291 domain-containing protein n=1 Tax=Kitasatospora sp. NPDC056327 TaxID=3345785 RepID=UPI0035D7F834